MKRTDDSVSVSPHPEAVECSRGMDTEKNARRRCDPLPGGGRRGPRPESASVTPGCGTVFARAVRFPGIGAGKGMPGNLAWTDVSNGSPLLWVTATGAAAEEFGIKVGGMTPVQPGHGGVQVAFRCGRSRR